MARIGNACIGDGQPCFITFEAGPTHNGLATAMQLVAHAASSGANAVKFQIVDPDRLVADRKQPFRYSVFLDKMGTRMEEVEEPLYDILTRRCLSEHEWKQLKAYCDSLGMEFFATVTYDDELGLLERLGCQSVKIASGDVNHLGLIRKAAKTGMCVQLDTGNATLGEIEVAYDACLRAGNENIIIHNCPSGYPARLQSIDLRIIPTIKHMFGCAVAFSDHTVGRDMDVAAVALGANMLEKTITLDRTTRSVEHCFSLEPEDMQEFVTAIRDVEIALGNTRRVFHATDDTKRMAVRRSAFTAKPVKQGEPLNEQTVIFRRPGYGLAPDQIEKLGATRFSADLEAGHMLTLKDIE
jgi:sialic acid synthase SpsE